MKNYIHHDPNWFYRLCNQIMNSDDKTIRDLIRVFSGKAREYQQNYWYTNRSVLLIKQNKKYANLSKEEREERLKQNRLRYAQNRLNELEKKRIHFQINYPKLRLAALTHYGNGKLECVCCGETNQRFLTFDHINNDGKEHRKQKGVGTNLLVWITRNNFPKGFQTLCFNCNSGRSLNKGICPHKEKQIQKRNMPEIHIKWHGVA